MWARIISSVVLVESFPHRGQDRGRRGRRALRCAHQRDDLDAHVLDLPVYELGNVLIRALGWEAADVDDQLDDLLAICCPPLAMAAEWLRSAAMPASEHGLILYDALRAAATRALGIPLVSDDARLLAAGVTESPAAVASRLRLRHDPFDAQAANRRARDVFE